MNQKTGFSILVTTIGMVVVGCGSNPSNGAQSNSAAVSSSCDPNAWVNLTSNESACDGNIGESCGWTATNEGQGYHCASMSWGTGCEPGGQTCGGSATASCGGSTGSTGSTGSSGSTADSGGGSTGGPGLAGVISQSQFQSLFPSAAAIYSYAGLVQAAASFPAFATTGSSDDRAREVAAFLANTGHESGSFVYVNEIDQSGNYCQPSASCPCSSSDGYFGRGAIQLSWNFNYCAAGTAMGVDLVDNPDLVATTPSLAFGTAVWYWMTQGGPGGTPAHQEITSGSFGGTIAAINGSIECNGGNTAEMQDRVTRYQQICAVLGVDPGSNLTC